MALAILLAGFVGLLVAPIPTLDITIDLPVGDAMPIVREVKHAGSPAVFALPLLALVGLCPLIVWLAVGILRKRGRDL